MYGASPAAAHDRSGIDLFRARASGTQTLANIVVHSTPPLNTVLGGVVWIQRLDGNVPALADPGTVVPLNAPIRAPLDSGILSHCEFFDRSLN